MDHCLVAVVLTLVSTLPICLCKVPVAADCITATTIVCAAQDLFVPCAMVGVAPAITTAVACASGLACYEEVPPTSPTPVACTAVPPPCGVAGTFPHSIVGPRTFYTCLETGTGYAQVIKTCEVGYNFNKDTLKCESIANPPKQPACMFPGQRFVDLNDCRHFRACNLGGQVVTKQCPFRLKFDASLLICTTTADCGTRPSTILI